MLEGLIPGGEPFFLLGMVLGHSPRATSKLTQKCILLQEVG
jgi:hypothetical protein